MSDKLSELTVMASRRQSPTASGSTSCELGLSLSKSSTTAFSEHPDFLAESLKPVMARNNKCSNMAVM
ncbi:hypothetical protein [Pseudomonas taetrolens]|uniref:hypothetical protein n=1 Tax=Pseudomonas taetrolens TaxID=47884 RepID=UPI000F821789|nr:hypothetical protein [Pseudomonas taetrolens]